MYSMRVRTVHEVLEVKCCSWRNPQVEKEDTLKKSIVAFLIVLLAVLALPVTGAFAASTAAQLHSQKPPVVSQKPPQHSSVHGSGHASRATARLSITRRADGVMELGPWNPSFTFSGVPVGGWANLTIFSDGSYNFSGHFHDSGFFGYNDSLVWAVQDSNGTVYTFTHSGSVGGTINLFSSRNDDWDNFGSNPALAAGWNALMNGWAYQWEAAVNFDLGSLFNEVLKAFSFVGAVIAIV